MNNTEQNLKDRKPGAEYTPEDLPEPPVVVYIDVCIPHSACN